VLSLYACSEPGVPVDTLMRMLASAPVYHYEIKSKLGVRSDIELVYLCMRQGLVASLAAPGAA
jgi:hypothetical protein